MCKDKNGAWYAQGMTLLYTVRPCDNEHFCVKTTYRKSSKKDQPVYFKDTNTCMCILTDRLSRSLLISMFS